MEHTSGTTLPSPIDRPTAVGVSLLLWFLVMDFVNGLRHWGLGRPRLRMYVRAPASWLGRKLSGSGSTIGDKNPAGAAAFVPRQWSPSPALQRIVISRRFEEYITKQNLEIKSRRKSKRTKNEQ